MQNVDNNLTRREVDNYMAIKDAKACPFCGNNELEWIKIRYNHLTEWHAIKCKPCKCSLTGLSKEGVIKRWNERTSDLTGS